MDITNIHEQLQAGQVKPAGETLPSQSPKLANCSCTLFLRKKNNKTSVRKAMQDGNEYFAGFLKKKKYIIQYTYIFSGTPNTKTFSGTVHENF